ncbi:calpain small subunit 1-like [Pseudophryne corroboree]|uniref:calpain small subunit 1-like n=1 Tax=Pseudophryne corroboree TaxID=495146 RepID=UPI003081F2E5
MFVRPWELHGVILRPGAERAELIRHTHPWQLECSYEYTHWVVTAQERTCTEFPSLLPLHRTTESAPSAQNPPICCFCTGQPSLLRLHKTTGSAPSAQNPPVCSVYTESPPLLLLHRTTESAPSAQDNIVCSVCTESPRLLLVHRTTESAQDPPVCSTCTQLSGLPPLRTDTMFLVNNFIKDVSGGGGGSGQGGGAGIGNILKGVVGSVAGSGQGGSVGNIVQGALSGLAGSGQGGGAGKFLQGALSSLSGSGGSGGQAGGAGKLFAGPAGAGASGGQGMNILGSILGVIGNAIANYKPEPPPVPTANSYLQEATENDEQRQFRRLFKQLAGEDMQVSPVELQNVLNKVVAKHQDLKTDGFSIDTCRSMVAVMDSDGTGKLGFEEFKYLWNNIKKWQCIYKQFDTEKTGYIPASAMPGAVEAAGFKLNEQLHQLLVRRYADNKGNVNFDSFISSLVRMDCMFRAFQALDRSGTGEVQVRLPEWLKMTIYS